DFVSAIIGGDDFFNVRGNGIYRKPAENMQILMKHQINEKMQFFLKVLMWIKSILIFGNGIMYTGWKKQTRKYTSREWITDPILGMVGSVNVRRTETLHNDPYIDTVFIKNFYPQPYKETIKDMSWCIERAYVDWEYIQKLKSQGIEGDVYKNLDKIKSTALPSGYKPVMNEMNTLVGISSSARQDPINKPVELLKYWRNDRIVILANRSVIIRDTPNPFQYGEIPYTDAKDYPLDKEFYAISDIDLLMPLQDKANDITNIRLDNLLQIVNRMFVAKRNSGINPDDFISRPSGVIWSDDINAVKPLIQPDISASAYNEEQETYRAMQRASGAFEYAQGETPRRQETATGIIKLQQAALKRFGYRIKLLQRTAFKDILTKIMRLNQQLLPMSYIIPDYENDKDIQLNPWDISGKFGLTVTGSTNLAGLEERMIQLWQAARNDPYFNQLELRKRLLNVFDIPDSDNLLNQTSQLLGNVQSLMPQGASQENPIDKIKEALSGQTV
ncbi:MAG: hypothetical protein DRP85_07565, partial [Candidatus Makaraimicrobium thalassicum]